jgi:hypothetical protein
MHHIWHVWKIHTNLWSVNLKGPLGGPRPRWKDNVKINIEGRGYEGVDWIHPTQDRAQWQILVSTALNIRLHIKCGKFSACLTTISFSRRTLLRLVTFQ